MSQFYIEIDRTKYNLSKRPEKVKSAYSIVLSLLPIYQKYIRSNIKHFILNSNLKTIYIPSDLYSALKIKPCRSFTLEYDLLNVGRFTSLVVQDLAVLDKFMISNPINKELIEKMKSDKVSEEDYKLIKEKNSLYNNYSLEKDYILSLTLDFYNSEEFNSYLKSL